MFLDNVTGDVYAMNLVKQFPYKSFSETLNLVLVSLLRQLVKSNSGCQSHVDPSIFFAPPNVPTSLTDMPSSFIKDVQTFVRALFLSGQNELQSRDHEASEKEEREHEQVALGSRCPHVNRFKLNVQTNAVCVDILVWATRDEYGKHG